MKFCERLDLSVKTARRSSWEAAATPDPEDPALFHRHDVERRTDDGIVGAQRIGLRHRKTLPAKRRVTLNRDRPHGRRQQFANGLRRINSDRVSSR